MAIITKAYVPGNILQGPADVYFGVSAPTSHVPPTQADEIALDTSLEPASETATITGITNVARPVVTTAAPNTYASGDLVVITGVLGATGANGTWNITVLTTTTFALQGALAPGVWSSGGTVIKGVHLGLIDAPSQATVTPKFNEIRADQFECPVDLAFDSVTAEIDFNVKEFDVVKIAAYFSADLLTNYNLLANTRVLQMGGMQSSVATLRSLMIVSPRRDLAGKAVYIFAFRAYLKSAIQLTFHRNAPNVFKLKFGVVADLTRLAGDELMQVVRTK